MPCAERRRCPRFPFDAHSVVVFQSVYRNVNILNISMHGVLLQAPNLAEFLEGPDCTMQIRAPGGRTHEFAATVACRRGENLVGLSLANSGASAQKELRRLIWNTLSANDASAFNPALQICAKTVGASSNISKATGRLRFSGALVVWEETLLVQKPSARPGA